MPPITQVEAFCSFSPLGMRIQPMRKSTSDLIWDFIVLCNERKAAKKLREYKACVNHDFDE